MLQSLDDFKVLFIQSWCFKHPSLPPPPPKKKYSCKALCSIQKILIKSKWL